MFGLKLLFTESIIKKKKAAKTKTDMNKKNNLNNLNDSDGNILRLIFPYSIASDPPEAARKPFRNE